MIQSLRSAVTMLLAVALVVVLAPSGAQATSYTLDFVYSGGTPSGSPPWLTADITGTGTVTILLTANLTGSEFISQVDFNITSNIDPSALTITNISGQTGTAASGKDCVAVQDGCTADGSHGYDVQFDFPTGGGDRFIGTETSTWTVTCSVLLDPDCAGFSAASFDVVNSSGHHDYHVAAHVQGIPQTSGGTCSGWISDQPGTQGQLLENCGGTTGSGSATTGTGFQVAEPASLVLLGAGLLGLGLAGAIGGRRRK